MGVFPRSDNHGSSEHDSTEHRVLSTNYGIVARLAFARRLLLGPRSTLLDNGTYVWNFRLTVSGVESSQSKSLQSLDAP
jgi:hypothetical protein